MGVFTKKPLSQGVGADNFWLSCRLSPPSPSLPVSIRQFELKVAFNPFSGETTFMNNSRLDTIFVLIGKKTERFKSSCT